MAVDEQEIERRIAARAHRLWIDHGRPAGGEAAFREEARMIVAMEDSQESMLKPVHADNVEPAEVMENLGEFPTTTDQGEGQAFPSRDNIPEKG